jgi:hypothetical protein
MTFSGQPAQRHAGAVTAEPGSETCEGTVQGLVGPPFPRPGRAVHRVLHESFQGLPIAVSEARDWPTSWRDCLSQRTRCSA